MIGYLTPFAALAAMITKAFTTRRNREKSVHWVTLFPATARATIQRSGHPQRDDAASLGRRRVDRD
ncbi:MAG TPA: hypothetical protein VGH98_09280 [Gemmatimonadaceae bacterium]|jgi:hypothetical protein